MFPERTRHMLSIKNEKVLRLLRNNSGSWRTMDQGFKSLQEMISRVEIHTLVDSQSNVGTEKALTKCTMVEKRHLKTASTFSALGSDVKFCRKNWIVVPVEVPSLFHRSFSEKCIKGLRDNCHFVPVCLLSSFFYLCLTCAQRVLSPSACLPSLPYFLRLISKSFGLSEASSCLSSGITT